MENTLLLPHLKQVYHDFSRNSCGFSCGFSFYPFPGWIKNRMFKNGIHNCLNFFSLYHKINMDKTSQKVKKDPKRVETACKDRENYMNKLKESVLNDVKKAEILAMKAMKLPAPPAVPPPQPRALPISPPVIRISMALVDLLSLPLAFAYFLHITTHRLQIKNKSMKNKISHQNDVICFGKIYNKMSSFDWNKNNEDSIKDGIVTATTTGILFALKAANVKPAKTPLDAMVIMKLAGGIFKGVLVKDCWKTNPRAMGGCLDGISCEHFTMIKALNWHQNFF